MTYSKLRDIWQALRSWLRGARFFALGPWQLPFSSCDNSEPSCRNRQVNPFLFEAYSWAQFLVGQAILGNLGSTSQPSCPSEMHGAAKLGERGASSSLYNPCTSAPNRLAKRSRGDFSYPPDHSSTDLY